MGFNLENPCTMKIHQCRYNLELNIYSWLWSLAKRSAPLLSEAREDSLRVPVQFGHTSWPQALLGTGESQPNWISVHSPGFAKRFLRLILARCPANRVLILSAQAAWLSVSATPQRGRVIWRSVAWSSTPLTGSCDTHWNSLPGKMERKDYRGSGVGGGTKLELRISHPFTSLHRTWWHCWTEWRPQLWNPARWSIHISPGMPEGERNMRHPCTQRSEALTSWPVSPPVLRMFVNYSRKKFWD